MLPTLTTTRYITPLRQGGSLPALVEASDGRRYVMKFAGAGQGSRALVAEVIAGEIGRALGLRVPELAFLILDQAIADGESHQEVRDLLQASVGLNLGMRFIDNALEYSPALRQSPSVGEASTIVWFDAYTTNVDRTPRNVNLLVAGGALWLIDHGACLYFHHSRGWQNDLTRAQTPFRPIKDHALLHLAADLRAADEAGRFFLDARQIHDIVSAVPDDWLRDGEAPAALRQAYEDYLVRRLAVSEVFVDEAQRAREAGG
jgi:hypothetical protein